MDLCDSTAWEPNKDFWVPLKTLVNDRVWTTVWIAGNIKGTATDFKNVTSSAITLLFFKC